LKIPLGPLSEQKRKFRWHICCDSCSGTEMS